MRLWAGMAVNPVEAVCVCVGVWVCAHNLLSLSLWQSGRSNLWAGIAETRTVDETRQGAIHTRDAEA